MEPILDTRARTPRGIDICEVFWWETRRGKPSKRRFQRNFQYGKIHRFIIPTKTASNFDLPLAWDPGIPKRMPYCHIESSHTLCIGVKCTSSTGTHIHNSCRMITSRNNTRLWMTLWDSCAIHQVRNGKQFMKAILEQAHTQTLEVLLYCTSDLCLLLMIDSKMKLVDFKYNLRIHGSMQHPSKILFCTPSHRNTWRAVSTSRMRCSSGPVKV